MEHKELGKLKDNVEDALRKIIAKGEDITPTELDVATKAVCLIDKIRDVEMDGDMYGERSGRSYDMRGREPRYSGDWQGYPVAPMSYGYVSHDGRAPMTYAGTRGSSHDGGYSGHDLKGKMLDVLERMRGEAHNERERKMVEDWIRLIANAEN